MPRRRRRARPTSSAAGLRAAAWPVALVVLSAVLRYGVGAPPLWVFVAAVAAIVPLADAMRAATERLATHAGTAVGGLLNVTFGNAAELILGLFVLAAGHGDVVKAQITGAIIGNSLLGLGLAVIVGSWGRPRQTFNREQAGLLSSLLFLSVIALLLPALFDYTERRLAKGAAGPLDEELSLGVSIVLILVYAANLAYTLVTHRDVFAPLCEVEEEEGAGGPGVGGALGILAAATAGTAFEAELVSDALEPTAHAVGLSTFFVGIVVLAVIGNAAEYLSAVYFARRDRMGLALAITVGSSIQMALVVAPLLVLVSYAMGQPMDLVFESPLELMAIGGVAFIVNTIAHDGETTWFEGVLLVAVYVLLALAFFFVTPGGR